MRTTECGSAETDLIAKVKDAERDKTGRDGGRQVHDAPVALELLAKRYRAALIAYFQRRRIPSDTAEDLTQEVFARLIKRQLNGIESAEAYLFTTASSVIIDHARRAKVRCEGEHDPIEDFELESGVPTPARVFAGKEALNRVAGILDELPDRTREIFVLSRLEGLTNTQLAVRYGISVSSIEKHMTRALAHIRNRFHGDG